MTIISVIFLLELCDLLKSKFCSRGHFEADFFALSSLLYRGDGQASIKSASLAAMRAQKAGGRKGSFLPPAFQ